MLFERVKVIVTAGECHANGMSLCNQLAKNRVNTHTHTHTGSEEKLGVCKQYGADVTINYKTQDFAAEVLAATEDKGINLILTVWERPATIIIVTLWVW